MVTPAQAARLALSLLSTAASAESTRPYAFADIALGARYEELARALDFRDIAQALNGPRREGKPDLGRRGYGCMPREDAHADRTCVSHDEAIGGEVVREFRLHFIEGRLQQFSITAEVRRIADVVSAIQALHGEPAADASAQAATFRWRNDVSSITGVGGRDLTFVAFELAGYPDAVKRKEVRLQRGARECR